MPDLAGTLGVKFTPLATMGAVGDGLASWTSDNSQQMRVVARSFSAMEPHVEVAAAPDDQPFRYVKQVIEIYPAPTLTSWARPINWKPVGGGVTDWGRLRIMFGTEDVTYWRGVPAQVKSWVINEPFGFARAEIGFPQIAPYEPLPPWMADWTTVDIRLVRPNGSERRLWLGVFADEEDSLDTSGSQLVAQMVGILYAADFYQEGPAITPKETTVDIGNIIRTELNPGNRPSLKTLPVVGPDIGITARTGGSWDSLITGYIQGLLDQTSHIDGDHMNQWTILMNNYAPVLQKKNIGDVHWTMRCGQPGLTHSLTRDLSMLPNVIFGEGVDANQCHWRNTKYPNLRTDAAPVFPGVVLSPGHSGDGVATYEQELHDNGWPIAVDNHYDPGEEWIIRDFQAQAGITVDGDVGPQTWAAIFEVGSNSGDLTGSYFAPLYVDTRVERWRYNPSGGIIGTNPAFVPGKTRIERHENFGNYISKPEAATGAVHEIIRDGGATLDAGYFGTITLKTDPNQGSKWEIEAGQNFLMQNHRGVNRLFHISSVDANWEAQEVTLTVDTRYRDQATIAAIISRDRENHDPARRKQVTHRNSKNIEDRRAQWDCENGSGVIPRHGTFHGLWNVLRIPAGELGTIVRAEFTLDVPARFSVGVFDRAITAAVLQGYGASPLDDGYWDPPGFPEESGLIIAWGGSGQAAGFYPGQESNDTDPLTGRLVDDSSWYFQTTVPPWLWVAIWVESPDVNYCSGRLFAGVND